MLTCPACPHREPIYGSGPKPARVMVIGEAGAQDEVKQRRVFVGKTGQEMDQQYLPMMGLDRDSVYMTNASKCPGRSKTGAIDNPTEDQARACWGYFSQFELREVDPEIIVVMGAIACDAVIGPGVDLEMQHGMPISGPTQEIELSTLYTVIPTYHPAAGKRDGSFMIAMQDDCRRIKKLARGDWSDVVVDPYLEPSYIEIEYETMLDTYFGRWGGGIYAGVDTEYLNARWPDRPEGKTWCVTVSIHPGTGIFIPATRPDLLRRLAYWLDKYVLVLHNALADLPKLAQVGIVPRPRRWIDTMQIAYWAGEFRVGLKILAYRYLGMRMSEFADVAGPASKYELYTYLQSAIAGMRAAVPDNRKGKGMTDVEKEIRKTLNLCTRLTADIETDAAVGYSLLKPWKRIEGWAKAGDADWKIRAIPIIEAFGGGIIPVASIEHVDRAVAVHYATCDADATLRLLPVIRRRARDVAREAA